MNGTDADAQVRGTQLVYAAIVLGALGFGIVVLVVTTQGLLDIGEAAGELRILAWVGAGSLAVLAPVAFVLRGALLQRASGGRARLEAGRAASILFAALLEGSCLLNLVAWLLVGDAMLNGIAALIAWGIMLAGFPTRGWLEGVE